MGREREAPKQNGYSLPYLFRGRTCECVDITMPIREKYTIFSNLKKKEKEKVLYSFLL